jgi:ketosteroid isomerase-like protein
MDSRQTCASKFATPALLLFLSLFGGHALAQATQTRSETLARVWLQRLAGTMEEQASEADVDHLLDLYTDDVVYEHPKAGARIAGKSAIRDGVSSHLHETRSPQLQVVRLISGDNFAVVEVTAKFYIHDGSKWLPLSRRQVIVLEMKGERIQRIIDHWDR